MTDDDQPKQRRTIMWPALGALAVSAGAAYALVYGLAAIPPFVALFLAGVLANVLHRLAEMLRARFNNIVTAALSAVTLMLGMLSGIILIAIVLLFILASGSSPLDEFLATDDTPQKLHLGFVLALYAMLALFGLMQIYSLWYLVRANAFGARHSSPLEDASEASG
jgi:predicted PurR-regulated permease PerM